MAREMVITCEVGGETPTKEYAIVDVETGDVYDLDLCEKHAKPLLALMAKGRKRSAPTGQPASVRSLNPRIRGRST